MRLAVLLLITLLVTGCSSGSPTASSNTYHDPKYNFSFQYPSGWSVPAQGTTDKTGATPLYIVHITGPQKHVQNLEVTVSTQFQPLPSFPNGKVARDPAGGPDIFRYYHTQMAGRPAMKVQRFYQNKMDGLFVIANTSNAQYQTRMITASPPFTSNAQAAFQKIVKTLKIGKS